jgi:UDP-N-acetylglucosamine/UDP-N-acetylgalactosamine 4-epimerase
MRDPALQARLKEQPHRWLVTGAAGFIASHLVESLLAAGQIVTGLDDLSSGSVTNLPLAKNAPFNFIRGDIRDSAACMAACRGVEYVLHHAAIGSVVKSVEDPVFVESVNGGGFANIMGAAADAGVKRVVYASSSAVYGDGGNHARREDEELRPLSPYAAGKIGNEVYARAIADSHGMGSVGLRYFNIYGPRQNPSGGYAAVIPKWISAVLAGDIVEIFGDGGQVRDFCHVSDVVQANIRAALTDDSAAVNEIYNIGSGNAVTLNDLLAMIAAATGRDIAPVYHAARAADIRISCADITKAHEKLGFIPAVTLADGLAQTARSYRMVAHG